MTKPITAVAAIDRPGSRALFELNDPVRRTSRRSPTHGVAQRIGGAPGTEPITEEMRIWHLFTHTSRADVRVHVRPPGRRPLPPRPASSGASPGDSTSPASRPAGRAAAAVPARHRVELRRWALDVLGRVVEVIPACRSTTFVQTHVLDPLGMTDTTWSVDEANAPTGWPRCTRRRRGLARRCASTPWATRPRRRRPAPWAAAGCVGPPATTSASPRCCAGAASSTACASSPRDRRLHGQQPPARRRRPLRRSAVHCSPRPRSTASASASASA